MKRKILKSRVPEEQESLWLHDKVYAWVPKLTTDGYVVWLEMYEQYYQFSYRSHRLYNHYKKSLHIPTGD